MVTVGLKGSVYPLRRIVHWLDTLSFMVSKKSDMIIDKREMAS